MKKIEKVFPIVFGAKHVNLLTFIVKIADSAVQGSGR